MITDTIIMLGLGFLLGVEHAFEPDHIVAISSLISKEKNLKKTTILGAIWGVGHTTTLFLAGIIILTLKITIPKTIALSLEFLVGLVIIFLGFYVIRNIIEKKKHIHKHTHNGRTHTHIHSHKGTDQHTHYHQSFSVGLIHGLAGSAALMLLILSTFNSLIIGIIYILLFGIGWNGYCWWSHKHPIHIFIKKIQLNKHSYSIWNGNDQHRIWILSPI